MVATGIPGIVSTGTREHLLPPGRYRHAVSARTHRTAEALEDVAALEWVVLTTGQRPKEVAAAVASVGAVSSCVVANGGGGDTESGATRVLKIEVNVGVPGGRDLAARSSSADILGFLDDDASCLSEVNERVVAAFDPPDIGAVSFRLIDEAGATAVRHVPRPLGRCATDSGNVATFLGGACAIRRDAYEQVGGYYTDLFYGHEEVELSWRLIDAGWRIRYLADVHVFHPRTDISRHADGWRLTGRNRVMIARRTLPWPVAAMHVSLWLVVGSLRAARQGSLRAYVSGWWSGWRHEVDRNPISWSGVWRLTRLGRPPII